MVDGRVANYRVGQKRGHRLITIILSNLNRFQFFSLKDFWVAIKWILQILPHFAYVATLPCKTLMPAKQALNDKLQDSIPACLRCGGVVKIKKGLSLSLRVKQILKSVNIWQSYNQ